MLEGTAAGGYDGQPLKASCASSTEGLAPPALCRRLGNRGRREAEGGKVENRAGGQEGRAEGDERPEGTKEEG